MGFYINPDNISKSDFFRVYCDELSREAWLVYRGDSIRVCLVDNGPFKALGIAYSRPEAAVFASISDTRPRRYGITTKAAIEGADRSWVDSIME